MIDMRVSTLHKNVVLELVKRDRTFGSPTYGQDLDTIEVYGPDAREGVCLLQGFSGLAHAPRTHVKDSWAYQEGVTLSEFPRVDERLIDLKLATKAKSPDEWFELEDRLWSILNFKTDAVLRVTTMTTVREINLRLERKPEDTMQYFPGEILHMVWNVTLIACDPWWYSTTLNHSWKRGASTPDAEGWYTGSVLVSNQADQDCWLEWSNGEIIEPEQWSLPDALARYPEGHELAGQQIMHTLPELGVGKMFLIQTHPLEETLTVMDNSQSWAEMRMEEFLYPIPPKTTTPVALTVKLKGGTPDSQIKVYMVQRHDRAWGA